MSTRVRGQNLNLSDCIGARIRELRLRHRLRLIDVSQRTGYSSSFLSRLERSNEETPHLKPGTFHIVLDAVGVTDQERRAVFHRERPPLRMEQIREEVTRSAGLFEGVATPTALLDEHWNWRYVNKSGRLLFGFTAEEYSRLLGTNTLCHLFDATSPMYSRFSPEMRRIYFSWKVASFKFHFAHHEFCEWYKDIQNAISQVEWARRTWDDPFILSTLMDSHEVTLIHPAAGELHFRDQLNQHMRSPRFCLLEWAPTDEITALKAHALTSQEYWLQSEKEKEVKEPSTLEVVRLPWYDKGQEPTHAIANFDNEQLLDPFGDLHPAREGKLLH